MNQNVRNGREVVLLVDGDQFRVALVDAKAHVSTILEREHLSADHVHERLWIWQHEERSLTGQRIFREPPPKPIIEKSEKPLYDELIIKTPLRLTPHD